MQQINMINQINVAINGFGRIGRNVLRAWFESTAPLHFNIVAINDVADIRTLAHLFMYDSTHGRFNGTVQVQNNQLLINSNHKQLCVTVCQQANPQNLPWQQLNIGLVLECTGLFRDYASTSKHITAGAKRVMIGAAPFDQVDAAIVYGINEHTLKSSDTIISSVSCTTQALVPLVHILDNLVGIKHALMTEIHAVTTDQAVLDHTHRDLRRARAAGFNIIPTTSSALGALKQVLPHMANRIEGCSIRVPTINVAAIDLSIHMQNPLDAQNLNQQLIQVSQQYAHIMTTTDAPLVSSDFNHQAQSLCIDLLQTQVVGELAKVYAWYDNEWGYANRMIDISQYISQHLN